MGTWWKLVGVALLLLLLFFAVRGPVVHHFEGKFLNTGPNGPETPGTVGTPYERVAIPSRDRRLDAYLVEAPPACDPKVALLIFHGVQETISEWVKAQRFLYDHCVSSLVFDYSGHGDSSRPGTVENLNDDAIAAYSYFVSRFVKETRLCVLGHSMGNAPLLESLPSFQPAPACVVVGSAFSSLRDSGAHGPHSLRGPLRLLLYVMPDDWDNVKNVARAHPPLLVIHSDTDSVNPVEWGKQVFEKAPQPKQMVVVHGFKHNAIYQNPNEAWWTPVLRFIKGEPAKSDPLSHPAAAGGR